MIPFDSELPSFRVEHLWIYSFDFVVRRGQGARATRVDSQ